MDHKSNYGGLLWMTGKYNKTSSFSSEPPFSHLSSLSSPLIRELTTPTDHVAIKPHYGTFKK